MHVLFRSQDLWDLVNSGYIKVIDSNEFEILSKEQKYSLKEISESTPYNIPSSRWIYIWENLKGGNNKKKHGLITLQKLYKSDNRVRWIQVSLHEWLWIDLILFWSGTNHYKLDAG